MMGNGTVHRDKTERSGFLQDNTAVHVSELQKE